MRVRYPTRCPGPPDAFDKTIASVPCAIFNTMARECEHRRFRNGYGKRFTTFIMPAHRIKGCSLDSIEQGLKMIEAIALRPQEKKEWGQLFGLFMVKPHLPPLPIRQPQAKLTPLHTIEITLAGTYWAFPLKELESAVLWHIEFVMNKERRYH